MRNSDEIVKVSFEQNYQLSNFFQTMMHIETSFFLVQITLSAMNKSQASKLQLEANDHQPGIASKNLAEISLNFENFASLL